MLGSFRRKVVERVEKESREEIFRIAREWDKLSPEEKCGRSIADFLERRWKELDEEREARREERHVRRNDPNLFRLLYIPFGYIPYLDGSSRPFG